MNKLKAFSVCSAFAGIVMAVGHLDYSTQTASEPDWILLALLIGVAFAGMALRTACQMVEENGH